MLQQPGTPGGWCAPVHLNAVRYRSPVEASTTRTRLVVSLRSAADGNTIGCPHLAGAGF